MSRQIDESVVKKMKDTTESGVIDSARVLLGEHPLCDSCLGRQFAWLSTDTTNRQRGKAIKSVLTMTADWKLKSKDVESGARLLRILAGNGMYGPAKTLAERNAITYDSKSVCHLCSIDGESIFDKIPRLVDKILIAVQDIEYETFLVGCVPPPVLVDREDEMRGNHGVLHGETLKSHFNRELGKYIGEKTGKTVDFDRPDIVFIINPQNESVKLQINPIFIAGRYRKLQRGIPQSRWDCNACGGKGCDECKGTGRRYPDSISEYIGTPTQMIAQGTRFKFHAAGREDVDVLMLGSGRPFVVEISEPRKRTFDLSLVEKRINKEARGKIEVSDIGFTQRSKAQQIKEDASENIKEYQAIIQTEDVVEKKKLKKAEQTFAKVMISQRTPTRVQHRRSDLVREKLIHEVKLKSIDERTIDGFFKVQGGTYVKELISGDEGRTTPSLSEILNTRCTCVQLNVIAIYTVFTDHNA